LHKTAVIKYRSSKTTDLQTTNQPQQKNDNASENVGGINMLIIDYQVKKCVTYNTKHQLINMQLRHLV